MALGSTLGRGVVTHGPSMGVPHKHPGGRAPLRRVAVLVRGTSWGRKHPSQIQLKFPNLLISTITQGERGGQPRRGWVHLVNRPYLKVVVDNQKHMKGALELLDASRGPRSTDIDLKRRKPSLKITWGVPLTNRIVLIYLVHSCHNRVWRLNMKEEIVRDFFPYVVRFGCARLSVAIWRNYLKIKGLGFPDKVSRCYDVSKDVPPPKGATKLAPGLGPWVRDELTDCKMKLRFKELITYQSNKHLLLSPYLWAERYNWFFTFIKQDKFTLSAKKTVRYREVKLGARSTRLQTEFSTLLRSQVFGTDEIHARNSKSENIWRVFPHS